MTNHFSKVVDFAEQAMSIKYNTMVYELQRTGKKVLILSLGEAFFDIPLYSFDDLPIPQVYHYTNSRGIPELREKLSEFFLRTYDIPINYEKEILITAGSKAAIHFAFMAALNPGDEVLIPEPYWVSYPEQVKLCYGVPVCIPYYKTVFNFEEFITEKTRVIVINNPHNPTGYVYSEAEINHLLYLADKYQLWLFSDEAYSEFILNKKDFVSPGKIDREKKHTLVFNSISKNYGISGWRLGYVIANEKMIFNILKVNQHLITCPSTILEYYVEKHFFDILRHTKPQITALLERRNELAQYMTEIGLEYLPGPATFYFFVSISPSRLNSEEFCTRLLHEHFISTVPGRGYGASCDKFIRISVGTAPMEDIKQGLKKIKELIYETSTIAIQHSGKALVVAGGLWQVPLLRFLKAKGLHVTVVDPYLHSPGVQLADRHIPCDVRDADKILEIVAKDSFSLIATDQSDISVQTVAILNQHFNLPGNPPEISQRFVNKYLMRLLALEIGTPVPHFAKITRTEELNQFIEKQGLPIIIKPADSQSSRGVFKISEENRNKIDSFVISALKYSNCGYLIAEEFVDGQEITVEGFSSNFHHRSLALSSKKHFRTGIASELRYPANIPEDLYNRIIEINNHFVEKSGLRFGITHAEYMVDIKTGRISLIEIACRGGGTLISSDIAPWVSGINLYDYFFENLQGGITDLHGLEIQKRPAILKFLEFKPGQVSKINGLDIARGIPGVYACHLNFKPGDFIKPAEDDRSRQGFFIAFGNSETELDQIIARVNQALSISYE